MGKFYLNTRDKERSRSNLLRSKRPVVVRIIASGCNRSQDAAANSEYFLRSSIYFLAARLHPPFRLPFASPGITRLRSVPFRK